MIGEGGIDQGSWVWVTSLPFGFCCYFLSCVYQSDIVCLAVFVGLSVALISVSLCSFTAVSQSGMGSSIVVLSCRCSFSAGSVGFIT